MSTKVQIFAIHGAAKDRQTDCGAVVMLASSNIEQSSFVSSSRAIKHTGNLFYFIFGSAPYSIILQIYGHQALLDLLNCR